MEFETSLKVFFSWAGLLRPFTESPEFDKLRETITERKNNSVIYPQPQKNIFRVFRETQLKDLRVIIISNDPFPVKGQASGIAMSIEKQEDGSYPAKPKSLEEFMLGMENDVKDGLDLSRELRTGDLSYLLPQGVALLNVNLTVEEKKPGSHFDIWKGFSAFLISQIQLYKNGVIIVAMGKEAQQACKELNAFRNNCFYIETEHPIEGAIRKKNNVAGEGWKHRNVFTMINTIIEINNLGKPIDWLPEINS